MKQFKNKLSRYLGISSIVSWAIFASSIGGAVAVGYFAPIEEPWIRILIVIFTLLIGFLGTTVRELSNKISKLDPNLLEDKGKQLIDLARGALDESQSQLRNVMQAMPSIFVLAMDKRFQGYLSLIGRVIQESPKQAIVPLNSIIQTYLEAASLDIESVAKSKLIIKSHPEMADPRWRAVLSCAEENAFVIATSYVSPEWWVSNTTWMAQIEDAIKSGLQMARIFIVENEDELEANKSVMREQAKKGVQVNWVYAETLRAEGIEPQDMLVSGLFIPDFENPENSQKVLKNGSIFGEQVLELGRDKEGRKKPGFRMASKSVVLSAYSLEVNRAREDIQNMYRLSQRFDDPEWWSYFFDDQYVEITRYKEKTAEEEAEMLIRETKMRPNMRVLDLGCAYGRIELRLKQKLRDIEVIPIEYSRKLLDKAVSDSHDIFPTRGVFSYDMREIDTHFSEHFDVVISTYTSWGYFREADNQRMFDRVFRVLKAGGYFYLDIDNPNYIRSIDHLMAYESDGDMIHRWDTVKESEELDQHGKETRVYRRLSQFAAHAKDGSKKSKPLVSLRLYELGELQNIATERGFIFVSALDEHGKPWRDSAKAHPERLIVVLQKPQ